MKGKKPESSVFTNTFSLKEKNLDKAPPHKRDEIRRYQTVVRIPQIKSGHLYGFTTGVNIFLIEPTCEVAALLVSHSKYTNIVKGESLLQRVIAAS